MSDASLAESAPPAHAPPGARSRTRAVLLAVAVLALVPSIGTFTAPLVADDGAILGNVARRNSLADLWGAQYGLHLIRFWRPVTTWSWELQLATTGTSALALRLLNVACHVATACLGALIVRRLGGGVRAALLAGALTALFPYQGGTVTWAAGRVDSLCVVFVVMGGAVALGPRPALSAIPAVLACGAKETGFAVLAWIVLLRWAAGDDLRALVRRTRVPAALVLACLAWRAVALGDAVGGYPSAGLSGAGVVRAFRAWLPPVAPLLACTAVALAHGFATRTVNARLALAGLGIAAIGFAPMLPMLLEGVLEETNVRWLLAGEAGLALTAAAGLFSATARTRGALPIALVLIAFLGHRGAVAWADTHEWAESGHVAEERLDVARALVESEPASERPILFDGFPPAWKGAYCLKFGAVDRLRAPFEPTPRPVWPLRTVFGRREDERPPSTAKRPDGSVWPWNDPRPPRLAVTCEGEPVARRALSEDLFTDAYAGAPWIVGGAPAGSFLEVVAFTEMGYEPAAWRAVDADGAPAIDLRHVLMLSNGNVSIGGTLLTSADAGAEHGYLEVRAYDGDGRLVAASDWIDVTWSRDLVRIGAELLHASRSR